MSARKHRPHPSRHCGPAGEQGQPTNRPPAALFRQDRGRIEDLGPPLIPAEGGW